MDLMSEPLYIILFSTISGTIAYGIWLIFEKNLSLQKRFRFLYPMQKMVVAFYLVPFFYLWLRLPFIIDIQGFKGEKFFLWTPFIVWFRIGLFTCWLVGAIMVFIRYFIFIREMNKLFKNSLFPAEQQVVLLKDKIAKELHLHRKVEIYRSYGVLTPMVGGVWKKKILIPNRNYEESELKAILYHEMVHIKQWVIGFRYIVLVLQVVHWFNPLVRKLLLSLDEWSETSCDLAVHYDTICGLSFDEYFEIVMKGLETEYKKVFGLLIKFQKTKGVNERMSKVKNYKKERDLKLAGGILAMSLFMAVSSTTSMAAGLGINQVHNALYDFTETRTVVQKEENGYIVYEEELTAEDRAKMREMLTMQWRNGNFTFDEDLKADDLLYSNQFSVSNGGEIMVSASVSPSDVTVNVGIITPNGTKVYVSGEGLISNTFDVTKTGKYRVFIENESDTPVSVSGFVAYSD